MKLRVGVVGLDDTWDRLYKPALRALADRFEVRAFCADVSLLAEQAAREFGAVPVDGFRVLTARSDIDAVLMLAPNWYGPLPILAACDFGKAVYCAAALGLDPARADLIRQRVEQAGIAFMTELPRRHAPATLRLKELIATRLGRPRLMFCHERLGVLSSGGRNGRTRRVSMTHRLTELVDWCTYVAGTSPSSVVGVHHQTGEQGPDDYEMMSLDFSDPSAPGQGTLAQISCGQYFPASWHEAISFRPPAALQVCCEHGIAFVDLPATLIWFDDAGRHLESLESERPVGEQMLMHFHRSVVSLVRKTSDLEDAYRALRVVFQAQESFRTGRRIAVAE